MMAGAGAGTKSNKLNKARTQTSTATSSTQGSRTKSTTSDAASTKSKSKSASTSSQSILVNIVGGEYTGSKFELKHLTHKNGGFVGRSTGKKFREKGISVPRDLEVSTTHGKFECKGGRYFYTDTGSTNGSCIGGEEIEPETPYELVDGMEVSIGQTIMLIAFPR
uniref:FHA domain-containing protein n=1 Tax=Craspedostauros australis TaxID=1486917 RepID=A0A7R9WTS8_9STRA